MSSNYLFTSLDSVEPLTARKVHIRRLYDLLQICIHRNDFPRATRAWVILAHCKEIHWMTMWKTGLFLLGGEQQTSQDRLEYLRQMMFRNLDEREQVLQELIQQLILHGQHRAALDELELYLPTFPYQDNPVLHIYAGMVSLFLSQDAGNEASQLNYTRDAKAHFEHALDLDANNVVANAFLQKISSPRNNDKADNLEHGESDDEFVDSSQTGTPRTKRLRPDS